MVDFPADPSGQTTKPIQASLSSSDIAGPYSLLARGLEKTGEAADAVASSIADQAGIKAVTTDANGNIQVEHAPFVGPAAQHYADAIKFSALAQGEGAARRKDIELRTQFRDNPEGYQQAAEAFAKSMQDQYTKAAGPLVGMALRRAIEPITTQTYKGLLNEKERLDLHRGVAEIDSELDFARNQRYALANQGVTSGPEWNALTNKIDTLTSHKVNNPRLAYPQAKADNEKAEDLSELEARAVSFRAVQVYKDRQNGGYDKAIEFANGIKTDRSLNLSPERRDILANRAISQINAAAREDERIIKGVASDIAAVNRLSLNGMPVSPERMGQVQTAVQETGHPELQRLWREAIQTRNWAVDGRQMSPRQLEMQAAALEKTIRESGGNEQAEALLKANGALLKTARTEIGKDQLSWANRTGFMEVPPLELSRPDIAGQMVDRAARAKIIAEKYGTPVQFFRDDEKEALKTATAAGGQQMKAVAKMIVEGFGADAPKAMAEISKDAPTLAHVGALVMSGGNEGFTSDVVDGIGLLRDPGFKMPDFMKKPSGVVFAAQSARRQEQFGGAFSLMPDAGRAAQEAANNAFLIRAHRNNYDLALGTEKGAAPYGVKDQATSMAAYDRTLQESAGAHFVGDVQYGGVGSYTRGWRGFRSFDKVVVPPGIRADRFQDVIGAITDDDLRKMAISPEARTRAADLRNAVPIAVPGGYRFAQGDPRSADPKYVVNALGQPFKLDFDQLEPALRKRVPDAFLGQR